MHEIIITDECDKWISKEIDDATRIDVRAIVEVLAEIGPSLGRPYVDTVKDSEYKNMKELRIQSRRQVIRIFFIFDSKRNALLLIGGDKRGDKRFYQKYIKKADIIYKNYLSQLKEENDNDKDNKTKKFF
jgi:hypothetical protein